MPLHKIALFAFIAVASGGVLMSLLIMSRRRIPALLSNGHGLAGLGAVSLLFIANLLGREATPALGWWSLVVLLSGLIGGLLLFRVLFKHRAPLPLVAVHGMLGATGIYLLYRVVSGVVS